MKAKLALFIIAIAACAQTHAQLRTTFQSPNGVTEQCLAFPHIPGGVYSDGDAKAEQAFCAIDIYAPTTAICPKTWSTSPGTMIYSTEGRSQADYEAGHCAGKVGHKKLAKFKNTMMTQVTSWTYSQSSLLYYHFSRYFDTHAIIPPTVQRTFDVQEHYERISSRAQGMGRMNQAAWDVMRQAEQNPASYSPIDDLFTADRKQIYGILIKDKGSASGAELEGTEVSPWGAGQNNDFQKTPGFLSLTQSAALPQAISQGTRAALQDPLMAKAVGQVDAREVAYWMKDITEITLLDFIFSQQDRIQNIDMVWDWVWSNGTDTSSKKADEEVSRGRKGNIKRPADVPANAILIERAAINDNDGAGKFSYTNFTKKTQMLEKMRHYNPDTYRKLVQLNHDLQSKGSVYTYVAQNFGLAARDLQQLVNNTQLALSILKATCNAGQMHFDLKPKAFFLGQPTDEPVNCENP